MPPSVTSILQELPADLWAQLIYSRLQQKDCVRKVTVSFSSSLLPLSPLLSLLSPLPFLLPFSLLPSPSSSLPLPLPLPLFLPTSPPFPLPPPPYLSPLPPPYLSPSPLTPPPSSPFPFFSTGMGAGGVPTDKGAGKNGYI